MVRNHNSFLPIIIASMAFVSAGGTAPSTKTDFVTPTAVGEVSEEKAQAVQYLSSFDDAAISETDESVFYSSTELASDFFTVDKLAETDAKDDGTRIAYNVTYLKRLDIMYFDVNVLDASGQTIQTETLYGYPFVNENGQTDVKMDVHGTVVYASDLLEDETYEKDSVLNGTLPRHVCVLADSTCDGGSCLYPILSISQSITTFNQAWGLAKTFIIIPDLFTYGPIPYLFYVAKMTMAELDYAWNCKKTKPVGLIEDQGKYSDWRFGLSLGEYGGSVSKAGCECIALYNFLYDCGANPDLATIIALTELSNADLFWGVFGSNPVPNEVIQTLTGDILDLFNEKVVPLIREKIPGLATTILDEFISEQPGWFQTVLHICYDAAHNLTVDILEKALDVAVVVVNVFIDCYVAQLHDIGDVLRLLTYGHDLLSCGCLSDFDKNISSKRQGIVSFWNRTDSSGSIDIMSGVHTVYVRREESGYSGLNVTCDGNSLTSPSISGIIGTNNHGNPAFVSTQFLWGYVAV